MAISHLHLPDLFPFWSPDTPDLGCFVSQKHGLETYNFHVYGEPSPWVIVGESLSFLDHQAYFRVKCGKAAFFQRCLVYDIYDNGTLATVQWDDAGGDRDFNDLVVEVAVVRRRRFFDDLVLASEDEHALRRFVDEIEPKLEKPDRSYEGEDSGSSAETAS